LRQAEAIETDPAVQEEIQRAASSKK